jgi:hypothetical protein
MGMSRIVTLAAVAAALIAPMAIATSVSAAASPTLAASGGIPSGGVCNSAAPTGDVWHGTVIADIQSAVCPATDVGLAAEMRRKTAAIYPPDMVMGHSDHQ